MGGQRLVSSQSVTPAFLCSPHPIGSIGPAFWGQAGPAPGAQQPTRPGVQDAAGLAGWPLRRWQPPGLALAVAAAALGGGGVRHQNGMRRLGIPSTPAKPSNATGHLHQNIYLLQELRRLCVVFLVFVHRCSTYTLFFQIEIRSPRRWDQASSISTMAGQLGMVGS